MLFTFTHHCMLNSICFQHWPLCLQSFFLSLSLGHMTVVSDKRRGQVDTNWQWLPLVLLSSASVATPHSSRKPALVYSSREYTPPPPPHTHLSQDAEWCNSDLTIVLGERRIKVLIYQYRCVCLINCALMYCRYSNWSSVSHPHLQGTLVSVVV